jgi:hypothetical protein
VLQPEISKSDTGFGISKEFQLKKVLFFLNSIGYFVGAATFRNSNFQKTGGLAFLTTSPSDLELLWEGFADDIAVLGIRQLLWPDSDLI